MRILQIIDSLDNGGAEKMAVNYANALAGKIEFSGIATTRKEGNLKSHINPDVAYLFLNRKSTFDISAVLRLKKYCKKNRIDFLHAHSSSFFMAFMVKLTLPRIKIIWHNHNGYADRESKKLLFLLKLASCFFNGIISVNSKLHDWSGKNLHCSKLIYLSNFTSFRKDQKPITSLKGTNSKRILSLANLRFPKNHELLIEIAIKLKEHGSEWSFHLVGKDYEDAYSETIKRMIIQHNLSQTVFMYGSREDVQNCIHQADICILTSESEGFPVALIEYGLCRKPVVVTDVGEIPLLVKNNENGFIVPKFDAENFYQSLLKLMKDADLRNSMGNKLHAALMSTNSEEKVVTDYLNWLYKFEDAE